VKVAPAPPTLAPAPPTPDETPAPKVLPNGIRVAWASKAPTEPVIDGDIAEWGILPPTPSVTLSVTKDGAYLVANLAGVTKDGIWIEISVPATELHPLGSWGRDGSFYNYNDPEYEKPFKKLIENHARFVEKHAARFQKLYRLDSKGILWDSKKGLAPIPNAVAVSKVVDDRLTAEVKLPLSALPRMSEAPANSFSLYVAAGSSTKMPKIDSEERAQVVLKAGIHFEPHSELRAAVAHPEFGTSEDRWSLSYQPSEPNIVELVDFRDRENGGTLMDATEQVLWEPVTKFGEFDVGYVHLLDAYLGLFKASKLVGTKKLPGQPKGFVQRNNTLHIFSLVEGSSLVQREQGGVAPWYWTAWHVMVLDAAGKISHAADFPDERAPKGAKEFHTKNFEQFGLRDKFFDRSFQFDNATGKYVLTTRELSAKR
jgi:hypothetical protein